MLIDLDIDTFTYPDVPLPQVWTVEQLFDTPALTGAEIEAKTREAVRTLVRSKISSAARAWRSAWAAAGWTTWWLRCGLRSRS